MSGTEKADDEIRLKYDLAANYLDDAISSRHIEFNPSPQGIRIYKLYKIPWLRYFLYMAFIIDVSLAFFEAPAAPGWQWPTWVTLTLELVCVTFFMARLFHEMMVCLSAKIFWKDTKHITNAAILLLTLVDICVFVATSSAVVRFSRPLRPFLLVNFPEARQVRRAFRTIRRSLPDLINVLILFMASLSLFSVMANKLFEKRGLEAADGGRYLSDFFDTFWEFYVLVTTANSPDIMMPAYNANRGYIMFFVAFLLVNLYLFMRVFLAVIYKSYKDNLKAEVREAVQLKRELLQRSFLLLKANNPEVAAGGSDGGGMSKSTFKTLMNQAVPGRLEEFWEVAWLILDVANNNAGQLPLEEFNHVTDLLDLRVVDIKRPQGLWLVPTHIYQSAPSKLLIKGVRQVYFRYAFDLLILVNFVFLAFDLDGGEPFFLTLFTLEIVLKLYAFGVRAFVRKFWNLFDIVVISSALLVTAVEAGGRSTSGTEVALDFLMALRVIRVLRVFHSVARFRVVINTILHILPSMATYLAILLVFYYFFAIIGMEIFGGLVKFNSNGSETIKYCGNPQLQNSDFVKDGYCQNNFNDLYSSLVTLFELMTVNQWHVITKGFVLVTHKAARLYFLSFHLVCVTLILNIFSAFVIEAFILEFNVTASAGGQPPQASPLMKRIAGMGLGYAGKRKARDDESPSGGLEDEDVLVEADHSPPEALAACDGGDTGLPDYSGTTGLRFYLTSRTRTVMGLLEKMFETDLEAVS